MELLALEQEVTEQIQSTYANTPIKTILQRVFQLAKDGLNLNIKLCFTMPEGFEQAYGVTNPVTGNIHVNEALCSPSNLVEPLFYFLHELRHAIQAAHPDWFSEAIQRNARYILQYDGTAYKIENNEILEVKLPGEQAYFTELYLASPAEVDANAFAYRCLSGVGGEKLERLYAMWSPEYRYFSREEADDEFLKAVEAIEAQLAKR